MKVIVVCDEETIVETVTKIETALDVAQGDDVVVLVDNVLAVEKGTLIIPESVRVVGL